MPATGIEDLLRQLAPPVLGAVVRRFGHFDTAEDATQEALLAAATQWPGAGIPDNPKAWLITVASRRLTDLLRAEQARRRREDTVARWTLPGDLVAAAAGDAGGSGHTPADDTLILLFMCCHPALSVTSQIALTLRAVGGLAPAEIARAFLTSEDTMTRRISRAKRQIRASGIPFAPPPAAEQAARLGAVLRVLYLVFNEGYASTSGPGLRRGDLSAEAIRLTRLIHRLLPGDGEVSGLLALMLLTEARKEARTGPGGELIPMSDQDRTRWDAAMIGEGVALITRALPAGPVGPYQLQAAIAAIHDEAHTADQTDWPQIVALYELLLQLADNPIVALNHTVAVAMASGPEAGLDLLARLDLERRLPGDHRPHAVRAHLLEMAGDRATAGDAYEAAASRATNLTQQRYLRARAARLVADV